MMLAFVVSQPAEAAIPTAVRWIEGALLGSVATGIAVLAVAFLGVGMLAGRLDWRTGLRVVLGVFILFGAPMIARELAALARDDAAAAPDAVAAGEVPPQPALPANAPDADPYAGAAMTR